MRSSLNVREDGWVVWHAWGRKEIHRVVWWRNLRGRDHFEDLGIDGRIILKYILKKQFGSLHMVSYGLG
jgi:hypothetical protein